MRQPNCKAEQRSKADAPSDYRTCPARLRAQEGSVASLWTDLNQHQGNVIRYLQARMPLLHL